MLFKKIEYYLSLQKTVLPFIEIPTICHYDICTNKFIDIPQKIKIDVPEIISNLLLLVFQAPRLHGLFLFRLFSFLSFCHCHIIFFFLSLNPCSK